MNQLIVLASVSLLFALSSFAPAEAAKVQCYICKSDDTGICKSPQDASSANTIVDGTEEETGKVVKTATGTCDECITVYTYDKDKEVSDIERLCGMDGDNMTDPDLFKEGCNEDEDKTDDTECVDKCTSDLCNDEEVKYETPEGEGGISCYTCTSVGDGSCKAPLDESASGVTLVTGCKSCVTQDSTALSVKTTTRYCITTDAGKFVDGCVGVGGANVCTKVCTTDKCNIGSDATAVRFAGILLVLATFFSVSLRA